MNDLKQLIQSKAKRFEDCNLSGALDKLAKLLDRSTPEEHVHQFLANNAFFLLQTPIYGHYLVVSKPKLGERLIPDFGLFGSCNGPWWTFVELEKPSDNVFTRSGDPSAALTHAIRQIKDWRSWISENIAYFKECFGAEHGFLGCQTPYVNMMIVIGRRSALNRENFKLLQQFNLDRYVTVVTYDYFLDCRKFLQKIAPDAIMHTVAYSFQEFTTIKQRHGFQALLGKWLCKSDWSW